MILTVNLSAAEQDVLDEVIRLYKLPLEHISGPDENKETNSDYFFNCDTSESLSFVEGIDYIDEAICADDEELAVKSLSSQEQYTLSNLIKFVDSYRSYII